MPPIIIHTSIREMVASESLSLLIPYNSVEPFSLYTRNIFCFTCYLQSFTYTLEFEQTKVNISYKIQAPRPYLFFL